jgi:hypothetical protein
MKSEQGFPEVTKDFNLELTKEGEEIAVELFFRCFISDEQSFYPMVVWTSIVHGEDLNETKIHHQKEYEKKYQKVLLEHVFVDIDGAIKLMPELSNLLIAEAGKEN